MAEVQVGFLTSLFGGTGNSIVTIGLALAVVLILIVLGVWALKLLLKASGNVRRGRNKRLSIIDTTIVDQKRQLVLIRRDNVEHLVMTGGGQDLLIETGIEPPAEQAQPVRPKRRPALSAFTNRTRKVAPRVEQAPPPPLPDTKPDEPELQQPVRAQQQVTTVENEDTLVAAPPPPAPAPAPQPTVADGDARGKSGQNALEKLSKLTRSTGDRRPTSLRHTGLLRSVNRVEPSINPQPSSNITQISDVDVADSAKNQPQSAKRKQGAELSDNDEGKSGAGSKKTDGTPDKAGTANRN